MLLSSGQRPPLLGKQKASQPRVSFSSACPGSVALTSVGSCLENVGSGFFVTGFRVVGKRSEEMLLGDERDPCKLSVWAVSPRPGAQHSVDAWRLLRLHSSPCSAHHWAAPPRQRLWG